MPTEFDDNQLNGQSLWSGEGDDDELLALYHIEMQKCPIHRAWCAELLAAERFWDSRLRVEFGVNYRSPPREREKEIRATAKSEKWSWSKEELELADMRMKQSRWRKMMDARHAHLREILRREPAVGPSAENLEAPVPSQIVRPRRSGKRPPNLKVEHRRQRKPAPISFWDRTAKNAADREKKKAENRKKGWQKRKAKCVKNVATS